MKLLAHLKTISRHRRLVRQGCFRIGLYYQGLVHDLSKYSPVEFLEGVKYFQGDRSPNTAEREDKGYSAAWMHHKGRNKHHYEYWTDYSADLPPGTTAPVPMPNRYVAEMMMDRIAASKVYKGKDYDDTCPLEYYQRGKDHIMIHPETRRKLETMLKILAERGEEALYRYIRVRLLGKKH
ncbi:MAG: DUF5662 family protein [Lachnospiraceae bacterium]|nr:DUF5662 family protein [Lachnospiraceae bacterium]